MDKNSLLNKYIAYLEVLQKRIDKYFNEQREFIKCQAGCDLCCKNSYYPTSQLEYEYVKIGLNKTFTKEERESINQEVLNIFRQRRAFAKNSDNLLDFAYKCPLLIDGKCSIYEYRPLLCRAHGLIYDDADKAEKTNIPHCVNVGLNYADVFDAETKDFSAEKIAALGIKSEPKSYNLSYTPLMKEAGDVEFGDIRMLFEWILMDIEGFEEIIRKD